jgi:hypothetical protein
MKCSSVSQDGKIHERTHRGTQNLVSGRVGLLPKCERCLSKGLRGQPQVKGSRFCRMHGGAGARKKLTPRGKLRVIARRSVRQARADGRLPPSLEFHPAFVACRTMRLITLRPPLIDAWHSADPGAWLAMVQRVSQETGDDYL